MCCAAAIRGGLGKTDMGRPYSRLLAFEGGVVWLVLLLLCQRAGSWSFCTAPAATPGATHSLPSCPCPGPEPAPPKGMYTRYTFLAPPAPTELIPAPLPCNGKIERYRLLSILDHSVSSQHQMRARVDFSRRARLSDVERKDLPLKSNVFFFLMPPTDCLVDST